MSRNLTAALGDDPRARIAPHGRIASERPPGEGSLLAEHGVRRTAVREAAAQEHDVELHRPVAGTGSPVGRTTAPGDG